MKCYALFSAIPNGAYAMFLPICKCYTPFSVSSVLSHITIKWGSSGVTKFLLQNLTWRPVKKKFSSAPTSERHPPLGWDHFQPTLVCKNVLFVFAENFMVLPWGFLKIIILNHLSVPILFVMNRMNRTSLFFD